MTRFFTRYQRSQKEVVKGKNHWFRNLQQKYLSRLKKKLIHCQIGEKTKTTGCITPALIELLKEVLQTAGEKTKGNVGHEEGKKNNRKVKIWQNQFFFSS